MVSTTGFEDCSHDKYRQLFAMLMDRLIDEVRQECPWTMMFTDDIVICSESREHVEENLEMFSLERRGTKPNQDRLHV